MKKVELNEPVMLSTDRMFKGYTYVVHADGDATLDGTAYVAKETIKVFEFKIKYPEVSAVHKCDMVGRCIAVKKVTKVRK